MQMSPDFKDLLQIFAEEKVEYLVVGGYAVMHHGQPRSTKDLDIWLKPSPENRDRVLRAFHRFGIPLMGGVEPDDFASEGLQYAVGVPPNMIDFLTSVPGLNFDNAWDRRVLVTSEIPILFVGKEDLIRSKEVAGRAQDLADLEELRKI